jgi:hypothetical protein
MGAATTTVPPVAYTAGTPIVIEAGKVRRKLVRQLKRGRGRLADEVAQAVAEVHASFGEEADGKEFVPVVLVYRRKRKRRGGFPLFPLLS